MGRLSLEQRILDRTRRTARRQIGRVRRWLKPPAMPDRADGRRLLHLGCGDIDAPGFTNVDLNPAPHVHVYTPLDDLGMFEDDSVDLVYASHCLEHFSHHETEAVLREWTRVLRPGGILRVAVPDFEVVVEAYREGVPLAQLSPYLLGQQDYVLNYHYAMFDELTLRELLESRGLREIRRWDPGTVADHDFRDASSARLPNGAPMSLNLEGTRP